MNRILTNRSVPADTVLPHVVYKDVPEAIAWLCRTFGFVEQYRYGASSDISGAQVRLGRAWIMLRKAGAGQAIPAELGYGTQSLTIFVDDLDAHFERAKSAGASILEDLHETVYGELQYAARDFAGHHWLFSRHVRDRNPSEWGAAVSETIGPVALLRRPRLCYLEIPALDLKRSAAFYEDVFGWNIRHRDSNRPSFDDATGALSGAWVMGREPSTNPGLLPYIWVDSIQEIAVRVAANGCVMVEDAHPDSPGSSNLVAQFRDPAGNIMGLYQ